MNKKEIDKLMQLNERSDKLGGLGSGKLESLWLSDLCNGSVHLHLGCFFADAVADTFHHLLR